MNGIVNGMSIDVEDYFQVSAFDRVVSRADWGRLESRVVANTEGLLEMFATSRVRGTFFFLGWVAERFPALVKTVASAGHEIASHGFNHQLVYSLTEEEFRQDVRSSKRLLEDLTGQRVRGYRAPSFSVTKQSLWALDVLIDEGYEYDTSIFPVHHDRYGIADAPRHAHVITRQAGTIVEMPGSTTRLGGVNLPVAGGGYFRLLPYAWTRTGIARVNRSEGKPVVFYLHPWEIDPGQPRFHVPAATKIRHYTGLSSTRHRLLRLLKQFRFDTIESVLAGQGLSSSAAA
ncbi:MAG: XrtA system polysaccharide deacetylase [Vicinamibacterales bacterium]